MFWTRWALDRGLLMSAVLALGGCLSDPIGVGDLTLVVEGESADSVWVGLPGADTVVRVRLYDLEGNPVAGAELSWTPSGTGSNVSTMTARSDRQGYAIARWRIGTDASERQSLRLNARRAGAMREIVIHGQVVPAVVATVRANHQLPLVARLGDTLRLDVVAVDPFGNAFAAPDLELSVTDSLFGRIVDGGLVAGPRRGRAAIRVSSAGTATEFPVQVVQRIAAIDVSVDSLRFTSLRAEHAVSYVIRDDLGQVVTDTVLDARIADTSIALWAGDRIRAVEPGVTELMLSLGNATARVAINVQQRVHSLRLIRDTVRFDALSDTTTLRPVALDSLGSEIRQPRLEYQVSGDTIARIGSGQKLEALRPGATVVTVRDPETGLAASVEVVVRQLVASIHLPVIPIEFDALGDSALVIATLRDRLGALVSGVVLEYVVADTLVAVLDTGTNRVRAVAPGTTVITVREPESGLQASRTIRVEQVATALNVTVLHNGSVITLPAGTPLALACGAVDRNGNTIASEPRFVRAVRGTVNGATCSDIVIQRSGYDTLVFAHGAVETRVPVIVATRPDSVGVVVAAQPLTTDLRARFEGEDFRNPLIVALRPLVADIMAAYGNPTSRLDRARALRDWVARTAIHPDPSLHPDYSTANLSVLPVGKSWADVNALKWREPEDHLYWSNKYYDGYVMLDKLLGTLDVSTGLRAADGMMEQVAGAWYRVRDVVAYRYVLCSYQSIILSALWAADGLHGFRVAIVEHDPAAVFIPELGDWSYQDPTFNEEYRLDGVGTPLSPLQLAAISSAGQVSRLRAIKSAGPSYDPEPYIAGRRYLDAGHPEGFMIAGGQLNARVIGRQARFATRYVQASVPQLPSVPAPWSDANSYLPVAPEVAFPMLAPVVQDLRLEDSVAVVRLSSTFPNHHQFERRLPGESWEAVGEVDVLPVGECRVEYRSVDATGSVSANAAIDVWVPRSDDFVRSAAPGALRAGARLCVSPSIE